MNSEYSTQAVAYTETPRRWLLGLEPIFEGGWLHKGERAQSWDVEERLVALSVFGDVEVDLASAKSLPPIIELSAYPLGRDVDIRVPEGTAVEVVSSWTTGHVNYEVPDVPADRRTCLLRVTNRSILGDVNIRCTESY